MSSETAGDCAAPTDARGPARGTKIVAAIATVRRRRQVSLELPRPATKGAYDLLLGDSENRTATRGWRGVDGADERGFNDHLTIPTGPSTCMRTTVQLRHISGIGLELRPTDRHPQHSRLRQQDPQARLTGAARLRDVGLPGDDLRDRATWRGRRDRGRRLLAVLHLEQDLDQGRAEPWRRRGPSRSWRSQSKCRPCKPGRGPALSRRVDRARVDRSGDAVSNGRAAT